MDKRLNYYDVQRHWTKRIKPHLDDPELNVILVRDFNKYTWGRWRIQFNAGQFPDEFETGCWQFATVCDRSRFIWQSTR